MHLAGQKMATRFLLATGFAAALLAAGPVGAQPLGTFRWQLAPYCNVVTLDVTITGSVGALTGFDDLCGTGRAAVAGTALLNLDGTFGLSLSLHEPSGFRRDVLVTLSPGTGSGPWRDSGGLAGTFAFAPSAPAAGPPRPTTGLAIGAQALAANTTGQGNTAVGHRALMSTVDHFRTTAVGDGALAGPLSASDNTAIGAGALGTGPVGFNNTAVGSRAGGAGSSNTAVGTRALEKATGESNVAMGEDALSENLTGGGNTAVGTGALRLAQGINNIALGNGAGLFLGSGFNNIYIGNNGPASPGATENQTIRIGDFQSATFIAGIVNTQVTGVQVCVTTDGQLGDCGFVASTVHLKDDVAPIGTASRRLLDLTPVTFRFRPGVVTGPPVLQHGLLAEEVAGLYPELARLDAEGTPVGVRYEALPVLLLSELQRQARELDRLTAELAELGALIKKDGVLADPRGNHSGRGW
jgi:hypothetical protein